jgi:hypothetical protein
MCLGSPPCTAISVPNLDDRMLGKNVFGHNCIYENEFPPFLGCISLSKFVIAEVLKIGKYETS